MEEYRQITLDEWTQWKEDIRRKLAETAGNFVHIGYRLKQIRDSGMYDGAADIFEFAEKEYGLGKSTVSRFIAINEKYSEGGNSLSLKEEFRNFSSSKLSEMLTLPDSEVALITEKTTVREIRELKAFNSQMPEEAEKTAGEEGKSTEAAGGEGNVRTPLEKCLIDFFKDKKDMLNSVMKHLKAEPPAYKEAAERMAPSQASHKKGIVFLFMYDWNTGVKYKLMGETEPFSMSWAEFLNTVYGIFWACGQDDAWGDFYKEPEGQQETEKAETEKTALTESNRDLEPVATSQQNEKKKQEKESDEASANQNEMTWNRDGQEAADIDNEESRENETQTAACADNRQAGEPAAGHEPADKASGAIGGSGENRAGSGADSESGAGAPVRPDGEQIEGQMDITEFPEYMPDADDDAREKHPAAAGAAEEPEKPEMTRAEAEPAEAAGVEDSGEKITDSDGMWQHITNQKKLLKETLRTMVFRCDEGDWDGLIEKANEIITRAEAIKDMVEVWHG